MLSCYLGKRATKRTISTEPFIHDNSQRILVACRTRLPLNLFWGHVRYSTDHFLLALRSGTLGNESNAKVTQQHFVASPQEHIFWLYVTMDQLFIMGTL